MEFNGYIMIRAAVAAYKSYLYAISYSPHWLRVFDVLSLFSEVINGVLEPIESFRLFDTVRESIPLIHHPI